MMAQTHIVRLPRDIDALRSYFAENANGNTRSGEGLRGCSVSNHSCEDLETTSHPHGYRWNRGEGTAGIISADKVRFDLRVS
jgi:hypothetical protein